MRVLILILLVAVCAAAQSKTIADIARERRALQSQGRSSKVYTTADITPIPKEAAADAAAPEATAAAPDAAAPEAAAAAESNPATPPAVDPVQQWLSETEKLRDRIRELIDQEATAQLNINSITNRVFAADTNETARNQAQTELAAAQQRLVGLRDQLAKSRSELQARELQGPPKK